MSAPIVAPIVLVEDDDLTVYDSVDALTADVEPWYPTTVAYEAYDAAGRRLELVADPPIVEQRGPLGLRTDSSPESDLLVRAREAEPTGADDLARRLRDWLARAGIPHVAREPLTLAQLIARARDHGA